MCILVNFGNLHGYHMARTVPISWHRVAVSSLVGHSSCVFVCESLWFSAPYDAPAGNRTQGTSMEGLYVTTTLQAPTETCAYDCSKKGT